MISTVWKERRIGKFRITMECLRECLCIPIFSQCTVMKADHLGYEGAVEYIAYSPNFHPTQEGTEIPNYVWTLLEDSDCAYATLVESPDYSSENKKLRERIAELERQQKAIREMMA